jgi:GDP-L-fucose synthase
MNILVTGASGFLGNSLCKYLEGLGHTVVKLDSKNADLRKDNSLSKFDNLQIDQIYHLAAWTQAGDFCLHHPGEQWIINQQINLNVLKWWSSSQPKAKLISMGTSCSYDPHAELKEENYLTGVPIDSLYTYAMTKRMLHIGLMSLNKQFNLRYLTVVPSTLYGADYHTDGRQMHFIFDLIRKIILGKFANQEVVLWGDGFQKRELVYVEDFTRILVELNAKYDNDIFNIGAGQEHTIREFAQIICKKIDYPFEKITFDTSKYVGAKSKCLVVDKARKALPSYQLTPLESGLNKTIEWFLTKKEEFLMST